MSKPGQSKFQIQQSSDEEEDKKTTTKTSNVEVKEQPKKPQSKFQVQQSSDEEETQKPKNDNAKGKEEPKKPQSKFQVQQSSDEEETQKPKNDNAKGKEEPKKPQSKFQVQQSSDEGEEENASKDKKQTSKGGNSKFAIQQDDDDSDDQNEKQGEAGQDKKTQNQKKKDKKKQKQETSTQPQAAGPKTETKKEEKKPGKTNVSALLAQKIKEKKEDIDARMKREAEEEKMREEEEERQRLEKERLEKEEKDRILKEKEDKIRLDKEAGLHLTKKQREKLERVEKMKEQQIKMLAQSGNIDLLKTIGVKTESDVPAQQQTSTETKTPEQPSQPEQPKKFQKKKFEDPETYKKRLEQEKKEQERLKQEQLEKEKQLNPQTQEQKEPNPDEEDWQSEIKDIQESPLSSDPKNPSQSAKKKKKSSVIEEDIFQKEKKGGDSILRSPIICILGHVDTGKTTLLDKLRNTSVQENEAGGITQQIGATFFPGSKVSQEISKCSSFYPTELKAPGILVIDTPGHESFSNLRSRGSGLCDFAILVIDLMHGLEKQTIESLQLLRDRKTPFVIALNKIDRCAEWKTTKFGSSYKSLEKQSQFTRDDFDKRYKEVVTQLNEQSFNVELYWKNENIKTHIPIVPTSGVTGEGIPDILSVIVKYTQQLMSKKFVAKDEFNCTVMEVKMIEGHGTTIDCILIDGILKRGDYITLLGFNGPIRTKIRAVLTPHPMKEMRVKGEYIHHEQIYAAMGVKLAAPGLEDAVAGSALYLSNTEEESEEANGLVSSQLDEVKNKVKLSPNGVGVAASTLGSLEALCMFLNQEKIPVSYVTVGPVSKDDVQKAMKSLLADEIENRKKEYAVMLVFDIKVRPEAQKYADENGVKIFTANIIYHLCKSYFDYHKIVQEERLNEKRKKAIFPCQLKIVKIFNQKQPIILGIEVEKGTLRAGCPLCYYDGQENPKIGFVESIQKEKKEINSANRLSGQVAIRIKETSNVQAGRHFTEEHKLLSIITRDSIDCLKEFFKDQVSQEEWLFIRDHLKKVFKIF